jgi:hypothetical protein
MPSHEQPEQQFPVKLTQAQRKVVAEIAPELADRLKLEERPQRTIPLTLAELKAVQKKATAAIGQASTGMKRNTLRSVTDLTTQAMEGAQGIGAIPVSQRVYQFKITLQRAHPPIWRRIQVKECTLDKLHQHIQTAMGWTNSHLNHFRIGEQLYGNPLLLHEIFEEMKYRDSTTTRISKILPKTGKQFQFQYEYDFGDSWYHEVLFEGCVQAEKGERYPLCVEGAQACPPEDVGGVRGYADFVEAIQNPGHEEHARMREWVGGRFDPEAFDPVKATQAMRKGIFAWRSERWG